MSILFVFDIDQTIANASPRLEAAGKEPSRANKGEYEEWVKSVTNPLIFHEDRPIAGMAYLLRALYDKSPRIGVYLTSRQQQWEKTTQEWLDKHQFPPFTLYMRDEEDFRSSTDLKETAINVLKYQYSADTVIVVDDDPENTLADVCKRNGWTFLKACP